MYISNESILVVLFVGLVAGWLAGKIVRGTGFGIIGDILVGIAGALVATFLFPKLGIHIGSGLVSEIIYSAIGAVVLLLIVRLVEPAGVSKALSEVGTGSREETASKQKQGDRSRPVASYVQRNRGRRD